jgi:preprotein translocase subunit SecB
MSEQNGDNQAQFALQRIYIKDLSFESPQAPVIFRDQWKPKVNLELNSSTAEIGEDLYEIVLNVTVTAKNEEDVALYLVEVQQAGIFMVKGLSGETLDQTLGAFCPNVLFPYARETIDSLIIKGSFPPVMLAPVNFDAVWQRTKQEREAQQH